MGISRGKNYCPECDTVRKGPGAHGKPNCPGTFEYMGKSWRPGKKGTRTRMWNDRVARRHKLVPPYLKYRVSTNYRHSTAMF